MQDGRSQAGRQQLATALLKLNMQGVKSGSELVNNPALQKLLIVRIRTEVARMSAEEIIALAAQDASNR